MGSVIIYFYVYVGDVEPFWLISSYLEPLSKKNLSTSNMMISPLLFGLSRLLLFDFA